MDGSDKLYNLLNVLNASQLYKVAKMVILIFKMVNFICNLPH